MTAVALALAILVLALGVAILVLRGRLTAAVDELSELRRSQASVAAELDELRYGAQRLSLALERLPVGVAAFDARGAVLFANSIATRYVAARHGEAVVELRVRRLVEDVVASGGEQSDDVEVHAGGTVHLHVDAVPVDEGGDIAALIVIEDRTREHRTDEIRRDFVANVSHELKTPLGALSVLAETLEGETDQHARDRLTRRIAEEAKRMGRLIEDILDLSQVEAEPFEAVVVSFDEIVRRVVEATGPAAREAGVDLALTLPEREAKILGDSRQLESAVGNLVGNAVKYTAARHDGGRTVRVALEHGPDAVSLTVADEGIGIAREHVGRIFERFYRVDRGRSRATGGTGLGLAIVRHVALNHGGRVEVDSTPGEGSTFVMRLPHDGLEPEAGA